MLTICGVRQGLKGNLIGIKYKIQSYRVVQPERCISEPGSDMNKLATIFVE